MNQDPTPSSSLVYSPTELDLSTTGGIIPHRVRPDLTSRLFAMKVDLEAVLEKKKESFRTELRKFVAEVQQMKSRVGFTPRLISTPISKERRVKGFKAFIMGLFGYERWERETSLEISKQLDTRDVTHQTEQFVNGALDLFETQVLGLVNVDATVQECLRLVSDHLYDDERAILRVAIRRSFARLDLRPLDMKFTPALPPSTLTDNQEITAVRDGAQKTLERVCDSILTKATKACRNLERDMEGILGDLDEEIVAAYLDRKTMEQMLETAIFKQNLNRSTLVMPDPYSLERPPSGSRIGARVKGPR